MTHLTDFPPDVMAIAHAARAAFISGPDSIETTIAKAIIADRVGRPLPKLGGLTAHQKRVMDYLTTFIAVNGIAPSYGEIAAHLGLASKSGVHRVITGLEERGAIQRRPNRARAITIIANPPAGA